MYFIIMATFENNLDVKTIELLQNIILLLGKNFSCKLNFFTKNLTVLAKAAQIAEDFDHICRPLW